MWINKFHGKLDHLGCMDGHVFSAGQDENRKVKWCGRLHIECGAELISSELFRNGQSLMIAGFLKVESAKIDYKMNVQKKKKKAKFMSNHK
jgi:hypothetical protein